MIKIERNFDHGYATPVHRGICFWLDTKKQRNLSLDQLVYEALGDDYDFAYGGDLQGVTISIEIEKASKSEWRPTQPA